jgi:hypothetical protein
MGLTNPELIELVGSGAIVSLLFWIFLDNRNSHRDIYDKLHADHTTLQEKLAEMWKYLAERNKDE